MSARDDREPIRVAELLGDVFDDDWSHAVHSLRVASHGQNAPVVAQLAYALIRLMPREAAQSPGSREFRQAARDALAARRIPFEPTRLDVRNGVAWLARNGLLPSWVYTAESFGGENVGRSR